MARKLFQGCKGRGEEPTGLSVHDVVLAEIALFYTDHDDCCTARDVVSIQVIVPARLKGNLRRLISAIYKTNAGEAWETTVSDNEH